MITVEQLLKRISDGESIKEICNTIGIATTTIQRRLKKLGYEWNNSTKEWEWKHDEEQPLNADLTKTYTKGATGKTKGNNPEITASNNDITNNEEKVTEGYSGITNSNKHITQKEKSNFTKEEIAILRKIIDEYTETRNGNPELAFFHRLRSLGKIKTTRKTVVMGKEVGEKLNEFAEHYRVDKSDILTVALIEFFEKYSK